MQGSTHLSLGALAGALTGAWLQPEPEWWPWLVSAGMFGGLLPDLDARESYLKHWGISLPFTSFKIKPFWLPSVLISRALGHRGAFHSLLFLAVGGAVWCVALPAQPAVALAFSLGFGFHLLGDSTTKAGVPWFWPLSMKLNLLPEMLSVRVGGFADQMVMLMAWLGVYHIGMKHAPPLMAILG